ncbi:MAG: hypothetical protein QXP78_00380 [Candidatus Bathyarchaeia archaeon]
MLSFQRTSTLSAITASFATLLFTLTVKVMYTSSPVGYGSIGVGRIQVIVFPETVPTGVELTYSTLVKSIVSLTTTL